MVDYNTITEENKTIYVGLDVHKNSFSMCCIRKHLGKDDDILFTDKMNADYNEVVKRLEALAELYGEDIIFKCGYEAGCLKYCFHKVSSL